jgi:hypothetical protein
MAERRTDRFHIVFSTTERTMLKVLADHNGLAEAQLVRSLVRKAFTASGMGLPIEPPPEPKKRGRR